MFATALVSAVLAWHDHEDVTAALASVDTFLERLTEQYTIDGRTVRTVLSSGGVATDALVSEGQAYGMLITSAVANSLPVNHRRRDEMIANAHQFYLGWRVMVRAPPLRSLASMRRVASALRLRSVARHPHAGAAHRANGGI